MTNESRSYAATVVDIALEDAANGVIPDIDPEYIVRVWADKSYVALGPDNSDDLSHKSNDYTDYNIHLFTDCADLKAFDAELFATIVNQHIGPEASICFDELESRMESLQNLLS